MSRLIKDRFCVFMTGAIILFASCSPARKVPAGDALYTGAKVKLDGPDLSRREKKSLRKDLVSLTRPKPNKQFLGIRFNLFFYNLGLFKKKLGEPPVLLSDVNLEYNEKVLQSSLENRGYFNAKVGGDTIVKRRKATAVYEVQTGSRYVIREVHFPSDTISDLQKAIVSSSGSSFLKPGDPFDLDLIKGERIRIDAYLKERGFYYFGPDYLIIQVDSTVDNNKVDLYLKVKPETPAPAKEIYRINDVFIFTNYRLRDTENSDTLKSHAELYKGYYVVDRRKLYKPSMFERAMQFSPGDIYNRADHNRTLSRLINMNLFKFVKNRFERVEYADSFRLNTYYYLTPLPKKNLSGEINAHTKSNNLTGSSLTLGWRNRNTFRGGELFSVKGTAGMEVQYSGNLKGFNTYNFGIETGLSLPKFLVPFFPVNTSGNFMPKTNMMLAYDILNKRKLYTMNSFRAEFGYSWKENIRKEHTLNPVSINYVQPLQITQLYKDSAVWNPTLLKAVERQFILGSNYNYNYNQLQGKPPMSGGFYFNGNIDLSGNIAGLASGANAKEGNQKKIFNAPFSQFVKLEADTRGYMKLSPSAIWANRLIAGLGIPHGNSTALPYVKQFFIGGTNSIRAFRSRSIGPGTYRDTISTNFLPDQSGDIKLELNTELRVKLSGPIHGALFVDAGNIWLFNTDTLKNGGKFSGRFLKELAVGAGAGLRFDISFLVIRFDVAFPLRKPYLPAGQRWVIDEINFGDPAWRRDNIVYNLGIGYPF